MNVKLSQSKPMAGALILSIVVLAFSSLTGCDQSPKSMFEQQAEIDAADEITTAVISDDKTVLVAPIAKDDHSNQLIKVNKQQAIARQPNCDASRTLCQYFELNVLEFIPKQPWLNSIMWKTIAQVLAPETPLASQDQTAKNTILMLLKQIEYGEQIVDTLPIYERIDTELVLHPVRSISSTETVATGYLLVTSTEELGSSRQYLDYVMLDVQKKLQLTIEDILLPTASTDEVIALFVSTKKDWLIAQGLTRSQVDAQPLQLSRQWYLDERGLHMVYQSGDLLDTNPDVVDLIVPYTLLAGLIKPAYIIKSTSD